MTGGEYRLVSDHVEDVQVGEDSRQYGPGDFVKLSDADCKVDANKALFDSGKLAKVATKGGEK